MLMSAPSHELAQYFDDQGAATLGVDLFTNDEPTAPDDVMTIYDTAGSAPVLFDEKLRDLGIQVRSRAGNYADAYQMQEDAFDILNAIKGQVIGGHRYIGVWMTSDVTNVGADDNDRSILTSNFRIERHPA